MNQVVFLARGLERAQAGLERTRSQLPQSQRQSAHRTRRARPSRSRTSRKARAKPDPTKTFSPAENPSFHMIRMNSAARVNVRAVAPSCGGENTRSHSHQHNRCAWIERQAKIPNAQARDKA